MIEVSNGYIVHCITLKFSISNVLYLKNINQQCGLSEAGIWSTERMVQPTLLSTPLTKYYTSLPFPVDISFHSLQGKICCLQQALQSHSRKFHKMRRACFLALLHYNRFLKLKLQRIYCPSCVSSKIWCPWKNYKWFCSHSHWSQIIEKILNKINFYTHKAFCVTDFSLQIQSWKVDFYTFSFLPVKLSFLKKYQVLGLSLHLS